MCATAIISFIHYFGVCRRLMEFLLNLKVKICAAIVRLSHVKLAESAIFANFSRKTGCKCFDICEISDHVHRISELKETLKETGICVETTSKIYWGFINV